MPGVSFAATPPYPHSPSYPPAAYDRSRSPSPGPYDRFRSTSPTRGDPFSSGPVEIEFESAPLTLHPDGYEQQNKGWSSSQATLGTGVGYAEVPYDDEEQAVGGSGGGLALPSGLHRTGSAQSLQDWQHRAAPLQRGPTRKVKLTKGHFVVVSAQQTPACRRELVMDDGFLDATGIPRPTCDCQQHRGPLQTSSQAGWYRQRVHSPPL